MSALNATHDPDRRSWVASANDPAGDFPIQNLPFGRFRRNGDTVRCGVAIGDHVLDLAIAREAGLLDVVPGEVAEAVAGDDLLPLLRLGNTAASALRWRLSNLLCIDGPDCRLALQICDRLLVPQCDVDMLLPTVVRQFSDMCVSTFHIGRRAGNDERGQPICPPVFRTLPVGYDGRASSVIVSGSPVRRPIGTWTTDLGGGDLAYGAEPRLDYELEVAAWFGGTGNAQGEPIPIEAAGDSVFGLSLLNDWSARGIQFWETMLGPFLGKSFATTVSPWIVTSEALAPFRIPAFARPEGDPAVPAYLQSITDQEAGGFDIALEARLRAGHAGAGAVISRTNFRHMYWTFAQMFAHHSGNGCGLAAGDLIGSGTCSGPELTEAACLLEANIAGPVTLSRDLKRMWLEDGDEVILTGRATRDGFAAIGFGEATGRILPAWPTDTRG